MQYVLISNFLHKYGSVNDYVEQSGVKSKLSCMFFFFMGKCRSLPPLSLSF